MIKISVYYEDRSVTEFEQSDERDISIGRAAGCSIPLDEASISRLHAVIRYINDQWVLERKANFGAVLLNGQEVENAALEGGEEISIGKFSLRVNIEGEADDSSGLRAAFGGNLPGGG
jgi:pSer/pThr/pTyr-binding forkhead associated (FHA) protein